MMLYRSNYLYFQSHVILLYTIFLPIFSILFLPHFYPILKTHLCTKIQLFYIVLSYRIENPYKMELIKMGPPYSTHRLSHASPFTHIKSRSRTYTHTLPSNYIWTLQKPPKAEIIEFIIPFYFQLIYTRSNPLLSYANIYRVTRQTCTGRRCFSSFSSLLFFFSPPVVRLLQLIQPGSLKSN